MTLPGPRFAKRAAALLAGVVAWLCPAGASVHAAVFQDWEIGCDNAGDCRAIGVSADRKAAGGFAAIDRRSNPDGEPLLWIRLPVNSDGIRGVSVFIDGRPAAGMADQLTPTPADSETDARSVLFDHRQSRALIGDMLNARLLSLRDEHGRDAVRVSLAGIGDALRHMDAAQGRTGTVAALDEPGDKSASDVKPAFAAPTVSLVLPPHGKHADAGLFLPIWQKVRHTTDLSCLDGDAREPGPQEIVRKVALLDDTHTLVQIDCTGGAYNTAALYFIVAGADVDGARRAAFELVDTRTGQLRPTVENRVVNGEYSPQTGEIAFFAKGRGMGDCGVYGTYGWTGARFVLLSQRQIDLCDGVDSNAWPTYWRTNIFEREGRKP